MPRAVAVVAGAAVLATALLIYNFWSGRGIDDDDDDGAATPRGETT
eukprot:CAMPEP_0119505596 /NCGR_PEP_ID=MMETSP1344-20130328/26100_1 /TAXON_ID=236787 /ORGANISM="Florenciella parvula, Strain CCMP2471" /LENGTH=45 /DNA_ID= /DNA_START= /DNA_END= /DNA_ORIENTATION=